MRASVSNCGVSTRISMAAGPGEAGPNIVGNIVGFPQKSGTYWALNPDTGGIIWHTFVGPGGSLGGIEWGTASDGSGSSPTFARKRHFHR